MPLLPGAARPTVSLPLFLGVPSPYGVLTPGYQDTTALRSFAPIGAVSLPLSGRSFCASRFTAYVCGENVTLVR